MLRAVFLTKGKLAFLILHTQTDNTYAHTAHTFVNTQLPESEHFC